MNDIAKKLVCIPLLVIILGLFGCDSSDKTQKAANVINMPETVIESDTTDNMEKVSELDIERQKKKEAQEKIQIEHERKKNEFITLLDKVYRKETKISIKTLKKYLKVKDEDLYFDVYYGVNGPFISVVDKRDGVYILPSYGSADDALYYLYDPSDERFYRFGDFYTYERDDGFFKLYVESIPKRAISNRIKRICLSYAQSCRRCQISY